MKSLRVLSVLLFWGFFGALSSGLLVESVQADSSKPLQYKFKKGQKFGYKVKIWADMPRSKKTYDGVIRYEVEDAGKGRLKCNGELNSKDDYKTPNDHSGVVLPPPLRLRHAFGGTITGLRHFSTTIEIAPNGKALKVKGSKHVPFLLGDVSTLVFERLDGARQDAWDIDRDMAVSEVTLFFRGFAPFMRGGLETVSSAHEKQSFKLLEKQGDGLLGFEKTYFSETLCDEGKFVLEGKGTWAFSPELGISESLKMKYEFVEEKSNISIKIPLEVEYTRISAEEIAKWEKKEEEEQEKIDRKYQKHKYPVTSEDQEKYIKMLTSREKGNQQKALHELSDWIDTTPNPALADAIRPLAVGKGYTANLAKRALEKFCLKTRLQKAYTGTMPLKKGQEGRAISKGTKLPKGLIISVQLHKGSWYSPARVVETLDGEEYYVEINAPVRNRLEKVSWSQVFLAPPEVDQLEIDEADLKKLYGDAIVLGKSVVREKPVVKPYIPEKSEFALAKEAEARRREIAALRDFRTWTDDSGTFQIIAKYISSDEKSVQLQRKDDRKLKVPLGRLSEEDRKAVKQLRSLPSNPFESNPFE